MKGAAVTRADQIAGRSGQRALAEFLDEEAQLLLLTLALTEQVEMAVDKRVDVAGRAAIGAILTLFTRQAAADPHPSRSGYRRAALNHRARSCAANQNRERKR
ncbi:MAG: hypothetical protein ACE5I3_02145, partial [Phycisphaerae bacterium]